MKKKTIAYPDYEIVDLNERPITYWPLPTKSSLLSSIKGQVRREMASKMIDNKDFNSLNEFLLKDNLSQDERNNWGRLHPSMMGGEYLPDLEEDEVEIARISIASVTYDQVSIRARRDGDMICYSVVDEYSDLDLTFYPKIEKSKSPLTYGEMIDLIQETPFAGYESDYAGLVMAVWMSESIVHDVKPPDQDPGFVKVTSEFYPLLTDYYEAVFDNYVQEYIEENEED